MREHPARVRRFVIPEEIPEPSEAPEVDEPPEVDAPEVAEIGDRP